MYCWRRCVNIGGALHGNNIRPWLRIDRLSTVEGSVVTRISEAGKKAGSEKPIGTDNNDVTHIQLQSKRRSKAQTSFLKPYIELAKPRLTALVVLSTMCSYAIAPVNPAASTSLITLLNLTSGTALCAASANTINMSLEPEHDSKMSRTRNRPLVRGAVVTTQAAKSALLTGVVGPLLLFYGVNPTVAALGLANILLYGFIYTPMKRISVWNTPVGGLVGAIPPIMGWAATLPADSAFQSLLEYPYGGLLLGALLFTWQFPHFNAFSFFTARDYQAAGYKMMSYLYPRLNTALAVANSVLCIPICAFLSLNGITSPFFLWDSTAVNLYLIAASARFWWKPNDATARKLFYISLVHLPLILILAMIHKTGLLDGLSAHLHGESESDINDTNVLKKTKIAQ